MARALATHAMRARPSSALVPSCLLSLLVACAGEEPEDLADPDDIGEVAQAVTSTTQEEASSSSCVSTACAAATTARC